MELLLVNVVGIAGVSFVLWLVNKISHAYFRRWRTLWQLYVFLFPAWILAGGLMQFLAPEWMWRLASWLVPIMIYSIHEMEVKPREEAATPAAPQPEQQEQHV